MHSIRVKISCLSAGQASRPAIRRAQFRAEARTHFGRPVDRKAEKKKPPMFGPMSRCVPSFGRGQQPCTPDGLGLVSGICGGRKKKQNKRQASKLPLCPVTTARSAGSCGVLKGRCSAHEIVALTLFSVEFGCLLRAAKSCWGVPGLLRHESPFKKCVAENKIGFQPGSQVVTFLKISARSPGYYWEVVIWCVADKEAARCTIT